MVLAPKPGGKWRFCLDYRKLNVMTKRELYPLPRLEDCIDSLLRSQLVQHAGCPLWLLAN